MTAGTTVFCKLTGKRMIIQKVLHNTIEDPMYVEKKIEVEKYICRYWSKLQDRFYTSVVYPEELSMTQPEFNFKKYDSLKSS